MKTLDITNRAAAVRHIADAIKTSEWNTGNPVYSGFVGWEKGAVMCPQNRFAFAETYGELVTHELEAEAEELIKADEARFLASPTREHERNAEANKAKAPTDLAVGDFVYAFDCGFKFDHQELTRHIRHYVEYAEDVKRRLCKIIRIEDVAAEFFDENGLLEWKPQADEGGCATDEDEETRKALEAKGDYSSWYSLVVLIRDRSGRCVYVDPEGYSYPRYVHMSLDYKTTFAAMYHAAVERVTYERIAEEAAQTAQEAAERAAYNERCAKWETRLTPVSDANDAKPNILAMARAAFPGVYFTCRKPPRRSWGRGYTLAWTNGPTVEEMKAATDFDLFETGRDTFDGMTDCAGIESAKYTDFADRFGRAFNGVDFDRTEAATDRNRDPSAVRHAAVVPLTPTEGATMTENTEKNGIELRFAVRPSDDVLDRLKANKWRWSRFAKCWYTKASDEARAFATEIVKSA